MPPSPSFCSTRYRPNCHGTAPVQRGGRPSPAAVTAGPARGGIVEASNGSEVMRMNSRLGPSDRTRDDGRYKSSAVRHKISVPTSPGPAMDHFAYRDRTLYCEDVPVPALAEAYGTPLYVYSRATLLHHLNQVQSAFAAAEPLLCFSVKTNANLSICKLMVDHGAGVDVTSGGELYRALRAGAPGSKIVYAGVGKTDPEMKYALENDVFLFNVESEGELLQLGEVARGMGRRANVALRVNPDLPPKTHVKTDTSVKGVKFGLDIETVLDVAKGIVGHPGLSVVGIHMHLGSPILSAD